MMAKDKRANNCCFECSPYRANWSVGWWWRWWIDLVHFSKIGALCYCLLAFLCFLHSFCKKLHILLRPYWPLPPFWLVTLVLWRFASAQVLNCCISASSKTIMASAKKAFNFIAEAFFKIPSFVVKKGKVVFFPKDIFYCVIFPLRNQSSNH